MSDSTEANQLLQEGDKLFAQGDYYPAVDTYNKALEIYQRGTSTFLKSMYFNGEAEAFLKIARVYQGFSEWAAYDAEKIEFDNLMRRRSQESGPDETNIQLPTTPPTPEPQSRLR